MDALEVAQRVADAAESVPGVVAVDRSSLDIAEYGPGGRVGGVALSEGAGGRHVTVAVCARYMGDLDLVALAADVRRAVLRAMGASEGPPGSRVDVVVSDLVIEEAPR